MRWPRGLNDGNGYDIKNLPTALARMELNAAFLPAHTRSENDLAIWRAGLRCRH